MRLSAEGQLEVQMATGKEKKVSRGEASDLDRDSNVNGLPRHQSSQPSLVQLRAAGLGLGRESENTWTRKCVEKTGVEPTTFQTRARGPKLAPDHSTARPMQGRSQPESCMGETPCQSSLYRSNLNG